MIRLTSMSFSHDDTCLRFNGLKDVSGIRWHRYTFTPLLYGFLPETGYQLYLFRFETELV